MIIFGYNVKFEDDKTISRGRVKAKDMQEATEWVKHNIIKGRATNTKVNEIKNQEQEKKKWDESQKQETSAVA